jgi:hypothetical protein
MGRSNMLSSLFGSFDAKVVAMPAEIFMVRLEAEARLLEEVLPSSRSRFIPYTPRPTRTRNLQAKSGTTKAFDNRRAAALRVGLD